MWVFDRYSPYSYQNNRDKYKDDDEKREFTLKECLWFCMTSLTPQGGGKWSFNNFSPAHLDHEFPLKARRQRILVDDLLQRLGGYSGEKSSRLKVLSF